MYVWWFATTPYIRFPWLGQYYFEPILVAALAIACVFGTREGQVVSATIFLMFIFFLCCELSLLLSPYRLFGLAVQWQQTYWKLLIFIVLTSWGLADIERLRQVTAGIGLVLLLYELHSLINFFGGGSFVWQQGLHRMVGVWSGGGIGAANGWGFLALYSLPFAMMWIAETGNSWWRRAGQALLATSIISIVLSGTRGALVIMAFYLAISVRRRFGVRALILVTAAAIVASWTIVPRAYVERYSTMLSFNESDDITPDQKIAIDSARARLTGLTDGVQLLLRRPTLGYGPGTSALARTEVNKSIVVAEGGQLHNLYGQVLSETGLVGTALFALVVGLQIRSLRIGMIRSDSTEWRRQSRLMSDMLLILLGYGMFAHMLFSWYWALAIALCAAFGSAWRIDSRQRRGSAEPSTDSAQAARAGG
jgi:hypothetical protein